MKTPNFVWYRIPVNKLGIPIFLFHRVLPEQFETYLRYLKQNGYRTITSSEIYSYLTGKENAPLRCVALTFDDGRFNNWSVAYPLLKKYNMKGVFFIAPELIEEGTTVRPNLEDYWKDKVKLEEVSVNPDDEAFLNWTELKMMKENGLADMQSHTLKHEICFVNSKIIDFQHPDCHSRPKYRWLWTAVDFPKSLPLWGAPVYSFKPRMVARKFFDDRELRNACVEYVKTNGEKMFFSQGGWRKRLHAVIKEYQKMHKLDERFETEDEKLQAIRNSLIQSRKILEERLNTPCLHISLPWASKNSLTIQCIRDAGYLSAFSQECPIKFNLPAMDAYRINRVEGYWIESLPGEGRMGIGKRILRKLKAKYYRE